MRKTEVAGVWWDRPKLERLRAYQDLMVAEGRVRYQFEGGIT